MVALLDTNDCDNIVFSCVFFYQPEICFSMFAEVDM